MAHWEKGGPYPLMGERPRVRYGGQGQVQWHRGGRPRQQPPPLWRNATGRSGPQLWKLAVGTWNVNSLTGKETALVDEVEQYQLDIVGLSATQSVGTGTKLLARGWSLAYSGGAEDATPQAGVAILTSPWLQAVILDFSPIDERVASMRLQVVEKKNLTVVCAYGPSDNTQYAAFLEKVASVIQKVASTDSLIILGDFSALVGNDGNNWRGVVGRHGFPDVDVNGEMFLEFCAQHHLAITNTIFQHKDTHKCTWDQRALDKKSIVDFVIVSTDLKPFILDTRVKRGADLSTEHHLVVCWIRCAGRRPEKPPRRIPDPLAFPRGRYPRVQSSVGNQTESEAAKDDPGESANLPNVKEGTVNIPRALWWTPEVSAAVRLKKSSYKAMLANPTQDHTERYRQAKKMAQKAVGDSKARAREVLDKASGKKTEREEQQRQEEQRNELQEEEELLDEEELQEQQEEQPQEQLQQEEQPQEQLQQEEQPQEQLQQEEQPQEQQQQEEQPREQQQQEEQPQETLMECSD